MVDDALQRFVEYMDSAGPLDAMPYLLGFFALMSLLVVLHEVGHAAVALACTESLVLLRVGRHPGVVRGRVGRLQFSLDVHRSERDESFAAVVADLTPGERVAFALAGPAANLAFALLLVPSFLAAAGGWRWAIGLAMAVSALMAMENLLSRDPRSDGRQALAALRHRGKHVPSDFDDAVGRWMALFADTRDRRFSRQRLFLFGVAPYELGVDPRPSNGEAREYWNAARAGWCWREVRAAPAAAISGAAREAWKRHSLEGRSGLELAGKAAADLARQAFPSDVEEAFLTTTELREAVPNERSRFAFRYGSALHDVERVMAEHGQRYW
jgi:hypothetical protein